MVIDMIRNAQISEGKLKIREGLDYLRFKFVRTIKNTYIIIISNHTNLHFLSFKIILGYDRF